jgi:hypothetical protein
MSSRTHLINTPKAKFWIFERNESRFGVLFLQEKAHAKSRILDTAHDFSFGKIVRMSGEDEGFD